MPARLQLFGKRFGRLVVNSQAASRDGMTMWNCRCECGATSLIIGKNLVKGNTKSCGCGRDRNHKTHGLRHHPGYNTWAHMLQRCTNPKSKDYRNYGARGIAVCKDWLKSFEDFWRDMGPTWKPDLSIERINNNLGYSKSNCCWATKQQQARNRRTSLQPK